MSDQAGEQVRDPGDVERLPLAVPVDDVGELVFRRLTAKDLVEADVERTGEGSEMMARLMAAATDQDLAKVIRELDGYDFDRAARIVVRLQRTSLDGKRPKIDVDDTGATIELCKPISVPSRREPQTELRLRRIKAKDLIRSDSEHWGEGHLFTLKLLAQQTGIPSGQLGELDAYDLNRIAGLQLGFTRSGPPTGGKASPPSQLSSASDEPTL